MECKMLRNLVLNLSKISQFVASNLKMSTNFVDREAKEEDIVHYKLEDTNIGDHESNPTNQGIKEAHSYHVSLISMFCKIFYILGVFLRKYTSKNDCDVLPEDSITLCM
jgi:hypothetical protein